VATQAVYYRDEDGSHPVKEFLRSELVTRARITIKGQIRELNGLPDDLPPLPFPQTSQIEGPLRELRCHSGADLYRILYRRSGNLFVLLHMLRKDRRAIPRRDVELAQRRWRNYKTRMDATERRGPRAAGEDAP
jgi:phage-related protein